MRSKNGDIICQMNQMGRHREPFIFLIDFEMKKPLIFPFSKSKEEIWFQIPGLSSFPDYRNHSSPEPWKTKPVAFENYKTGFDLVKQHISNGDTYLLNYTQPTIVETTNTLEDVFFQSSAKYKILLKNKFVCFSPETFIRIENGRIYSFPMKGTIDSDVQNSEKLILEDTKEIAEHNTIVDLIRNDLSLIAENVSVDKFRYLELLKTNHKNLWQVSSRISGDLPKDYSENMGNIIFTLLPAGSISGAPKKKTLEIIKKAEKYQRGYYTGVFGYFDGVNLDSCVLIRFIENSHGQLIYKSGGGITFMSEVEKEYEELLKKVYVPIA